MGLFDRLLGRKAPAPEAKASSVGAIIANVMLGRPVWQQRDFARFATEGYQRNVVVYACIWHTARAAASVPLCVRSRKIGQDAVEVTIPDLQALLDRPNPMQDGVSFRQEVLSDFLLGGNAYTERVDLSGKARELYRWRPDRVRAIPGPLGWPQAYIFKVGGMERTIPVDPTRPGGVPVWQMRDYSPVEDWYGMSALDPAAFSIDAHTGAEGWNKALIENSGRPSGALTYEPKDGPGKMSDDQFARLRQEIDQMFSGSANAGRPLLLDGGLKWTEMGLSPKDMDFVEGKNSSARDIALAMGVPPMILGIPGDNTYSNYTEANKAFYRQAVIPLIGQWCRGMSWWVARDFGPDLCVEPDIDDLPVFADERTAYWARIEAANDLTINEKRAMKGLQKIPGGDVLLVPANLIPLGSAGQAITGGAEDDSAEPADDETDENESDQKRWKYDPSQPRVPAGDPDGGQWAPAGGKPFSGTVYHGTDKDFESFDDRFIGSSTDPGHLGRGFYFSTDPEIGRTNSITMSADVNLKNPVRISMSSFYDDKKKLIRDAIGLSHSATASDVTAQMRQMGHDGVVLDYSKTGYNHQEIMVASQSAIKVIGKTHNKR